MVVYWKQLSYFLAPALPHSLWPSEPRLFKLADQKTLQLIPEKYEMQETNKHFSADEIINNGPY